MIDLDQNIILKQHEMITSLRQTNHQLQAELMELRAYKQRVNTAAEAIINRWYSPNWAWDQHTGTLINDLRVAIGSDKGDA